MDEPKKSFFVPGHQLTSRKILSLEPLGVTGKCLLQTNTIVAGKLAVSAIHVLFGLQNVRSNESRESYSVLILRLTST